MTVTPASQFGACPDARRALRDTSNLGRPRAPQRRHVSGDDLTVRESTVAGRSVGRRPNRQSPDVQWQQRGFETPDATTTTLEGDNPSMTLADVQQQRLLERLREAGDQPVAFAELHASGIDFPAAVVSELELNGYVIERVYDHRRPIGVRLLHP